MAEQNRQTLGLPQKGQGAQNKGAESGTRITYIAGQGDPASVKWRGIEFPANAAVSVVDEELVNLARGNPFFRVGDEPAAQNANAVPTTHMEYRGYVANWLNSVRTTEALILKWSSDRDLRERCDVGSDDFEYLGTLIEPKAASLARQDGLSDQQVASLWVKHGIFELPWRR
jgi:hypothetical protein